MPLMLDNVNINEGVENPCEVDVVTCSVVTYNVVRCTFIGNSTKQKD